MNGQHYSIVVVDDQKIKEKLYELSGQIHIDNSAVFLVFCANYTHIKIAGEIENQKINLENNYEQLVTAVTDASLAMQNAVIAAESLGYGTVCCGAIRNIAKDIEQLLNIPKGAFIVCGLSIGKLDLELTTERIKPRLPFEANVGFNKFPTVTKEQILEYNETMTKFAEARETKPWTEKMAVYHSNEPLENSLVAALERQGFKK